MTVLDELKQTLADVLRILAHSFGPSLKLLWITFWGAGAAVLSVPAVHEFYPVLGYDPVYLRSLQYFFLAVLMTTALMWFVLWHTDAKNQLLRYLSE